MKTTLARLCLGSMVPSILAKLSTKKAALFKAAFSFRNEPYFFPVSFPFEGVARSPAKSGLSIFGDGCDIMICNSDPVLRSIEYESPMVHPSAER